LFLGRLIIVACPPNPELIERWTLYVGTAGAFAEGVSAQFAIRFVMKSICLNFLENTSSQVASETVICDIILAELQKYSNLHSKVLGAALPRSVHAQRPSIFPYLWLELDIVLILLDEELDTKRTAPAMSQRIIVSVMAR
jgi:hypothetical protein